MGQIACPFASIFPLNVSIFNEEELKGFSSARTGGPVQWQELYAACVSETDSDRLEKLVYETEGAMFLRFQELACEPLASDEVQELKQAATGLLEFKVEQLGWPDPMKVKPRQKHHHFRVTVSYSDREQSAKVFVNRELADRFAARQSESPVVKSAQVMLD